MKKIFIGALLASAAFTAPALAQTAVTTVNEFCASQRLSAGDQAECRADMSAAATDAEKARVMEAYERKLTTPPLRNDLRANDAGVKRADQPTEPRTVESTGVTTAVPSTSSSTTVTVEPRAGASVTTGSSATVTTSALICADTRLSAKEQDDCSSAMQNAASADEQMSIQKRYEARLSGTPLRNDLKSNDAGVKGADQPATPRPN